MPPTEVALPRNAPWFKLWMPEQYATRTFRRGDSVPNALRGEWVHYPISIQERAMLWFMNRVTDEPGWQEAVQDADLVDAWLAQLPADSAERAEASVPLSPAATSNAHAPFSTVLGELPEDLGRRGFTKHMGSCCVQELKGQVASDAVRVFEADAVVFKLDVPLDAEARAAFAPLEEEARKRGAFRVGRKGTLAVVHPSEYPMTYGLTRVSFLGDVTRENCISAIGSGVLFSDPIDLADPSALLPKPSPRQDWRHRQYMRTSGQEKYQHLISQVFSYLPTDVEVTPAGCKLKGYVNNIHPSHAEAYTVIEKLLDAALPALHATVERAKATRLRGDRDKYKIDISKRKRRIPWPEKLDELFVCGTRQTCKRACRLVPPSQNGSGFREIIHHPPVTAERLEEFTRTHPFRVRQPRPLSPAPLKSPVPWKNLQVVVQVTAQDLTPQNPTYEGGDWHVEGMVNEQIVAAAVYYYDMENVLDSYLGLRARLASGNKFSDDITVGGCAFRPAVSEEDKQRRREALDHIYGERNDVLELGSVKAQQGRMVVFPNVIEHRVEPFELADKTKPGTRKMIAIFLVDPKVPIISTSFAPPQQGHWVPGTDTKEFADGAKKLPAELFNLISDKAKDEPCPYNRDVAARIQRDLMRERADVAIPGWSKASRAGLAD